MSMDVLIYNGKHDEGLMYDVSTPEKEAAAFLILFAYLDEDWDMYSDIEEPTPLAFCMPCVKELHRHCEGDCLCDATDECKKKSGRAKRELGRARETKSLYDKAKAGDAAAAKRLLYGRKDNEYEDFQLGSVMDPLEEKLALREGED
jgi:hypothetical protein